MDKEDQILLSITDEKLQRCSEDGRITVTGFLDLRQQSLIQSHYKQQTEPFFLFYGGYENAERKICIFFPYYIPLKTKDEGFFWLSEHPEENPLQLLRVKQNGYRELNHRDYLGSLLNLGVKRDRIGDILVAKTGCDIIIDPSMGKFLLQNYNKAGHTSLESELLELNQLLISEHVFEEFEDTVASLRADNVISSGFGISRSKANEAISSGLVFADGREVTKIDAQISEGVKLVLRGKGKIILHEIGDLSRKGRIFVRFHRYI